MNRYSGNSGIVERIPEHSAHGGTAREAEYSVPHEIIETRGSAARGASRGNSFLSSLPFGGLFSNNKSSEQSLFGGLDGLLSKFTKEKLEMEDYLLLGMLYLLYRESGDIEFLLIAGAMLLL